MPWPAKIVRLFDLAKSGGEKDESEFYGPFNAVLNYLFPYEEDYEIVPQYKRPEQSKSVDFTTIFIVRHEKHPVLFVEIKCSNHILQMSTRQAADQQMRERFTDLFDNVEIEKFYGLSAMGTRLCIYTADKQTGRLLPKQIPSSLEFVIDTAPIHRWDIDIMTPGARNDSGKLLVISRACALACEWDATRSKVVTESHRVSQLKMMRSPATMFLFCHWAMLSNKKCSRISGNPFESLAEFFVNSQYHFWKVIKGIISEAMIT